MQANISAIQQIANDAAPWRALGAAVLHRALLDWIRGDADAGQWLTTTGPIFWELLGGDVADYCERLDALGEGV